MVSCGRRGGPHPVCHWAQASKPELDAIYVVVANVVVGGSLSPAPRDEFVALNLPPPVEQVPPPETSSPPVARAIHIEVRRSAGVVTVNWPLEDAASCATWQYTAGHATLTPTIGLASTIRPQVSSGAAATHQSGCSDAPGAAPERF